jgi:hypothetical protein
MRASSIPWSLLLCMAAIGPVPGCGARSALTESFASGGGEGSEGGAGDGSQGEGGSEGDGGPGGGNPAVNLDVDGDSLSPSLLFDSKNTAHLLYSYSELNTGVFPYGARYAECPGNCDVFSSWKFATLHVQAMVSQLVLDSQGHPRFLFTRPPADPTCEVLGSLIFASCDEECTTASNWTFTTIAQGVAASRCAFGPGNILVGMPLAIDSTDRLRAAFPSSDTDLTLASCAAECSEVSNWISTHYSSYAAAASSNCARDLAIDGAGTVHMTTFSGAVGAYAELAQGASAWSVYPIPFPFGFPFRMRVDALGQPRILHAKAGKNGPFDSSAIVYSSCDTGCAAGGAWSSVTIPVPDGTAVPGDFVLDGTGTPHIAYAAPSDSVSCATGAFQALEYATWIGGSDGGPRGAWQFSTVQSSSVLQADTPMLGSQYNIDEPPELSVGPISIGLDTSGQSHFAFDVSKAGACPGETFGNGCPDGLRYASLTK